jgi:8-oxo-dGTP diphosphatase
MVENELNCIISFLEEDKIKNLSITGFAKNNPVSNMWQAGNSIAIMGSSDKNWIYFSSDNEEEFRQLSRLIDPKVTSFGSLTGWMIPILSENKNTEWVLPTYNYYLPDDVNLNHIKVMSRKLTPDDIPHILQHSLYKQYLSREYLKDRITRSYSAGIEMDGELAAWGLTHDDGALGSLHVTDNYRRHGFAKEIIKSLVEQCRDNDEIPFAQVEPGNIASAKLLEKFGFIKDRELTWMKVF